MAILENIDIDKGILQNIDIDKISYRLGFGISNTLRREGGGRRKFVYDCGVIGICPPCTRATPLTGVWPCWLVGEWRKPCASKPTSQQGSCALLAGGWRRKPCASKSFLHSPPSQQGTESLLAGGFTGARLPPLTHQPTGPHPCQGCCPCAWWSDTNNPAVINKLPPPSSTKFMTAVTAMGKTALTG